MVAGQGLTVIGSIVLMVLSCDVCDSILKHNRVFSTQ